LARWSWHGRKTARRSASGGRSLSARKALRKFVREREKAGELDEWRRGKAIVGSIEGERVVDLAAQLDVTLGSGNRWLQWYNAMGIEGLRTASPPGPSPKLNEAQRAELTALVEAGPIAAGYESGVWTGPMVGDLIEQRFGVRYHKHLEVGEGAAGIEVVFDVVEMALDAPRAVGVADAVRDEAKSESGRKPLHDRRWHSVRAGAMRDGATRRRTRPSASCSTAHATGATSR
jgi:transposase